MRIIAFIEDYKIVKKILDYLGIYEFKRDRPPADTLFIPGGSISEFLCIKYNC